MLELIKRFEGLRLTPYLCSAGVPTIGYGATYYQSGLKVTLFDAPITKAQAEELLRWHVQTVYLPGVLKRCPGLSGGRLEAVLSFAFNLGLGALARSSLRKAINAKDWSWAALEILKWNRAGGKPNRGLTVRRQAEALILDQKTPL
jgi:lysozyme